MHNEKPSGAVARQYHLQVVEGLEAKLSIAIARAEKAERERDQAILHDRQPYPTAAAYEAACAARTKWQERAEKAEAALKAYANPENWADDELGVSRVWREPGSSTPETYDGYDLASKALAGKGE